MIAQDWLVLSGILICLLLSFVFSGSETALTALSRVRMLRMESVGSERAGIINNLLRARERLVGALLIGSKAVNIAASVLATSLFLSWFGEIGLLYAAVVMTALIAIFTDVLPRTLAINAPERAALLVARPITWAACLLGPIFKGIEWLVRVLLMRFGVRLGAGQPVLSAQEELRGVIDLLHREGGVEKQHRDMFGGVLDLKELQVSDVMIHRTEMITVCADNPTDNVIREILAAPVTRIPLWSGKPENIVGILHAKNLLKALQAANGDVARIDLLSICRPPWFVPTIRPLTEQLKAFRRRKTPLALVVDEYGEMMGLVTLEDIIEEIVGDISDEHDLEVPGVRPQTDGSVTVEGSVPVRDLNRAMDWDLPDEEATTIAGLVIHEARSIPNVSQTFTFHGFRFRVLRKERNRITSLRITPLAGV